MVNNKANLEDSNSKKTVKSKKNSKNQDSSNSKETKVKKPFQKPKINYSELLESKYVQKWVDSYKNGQQQARLSVLVKYCEFLDKTPDQILEEHHKDVKQENPLDITNIGTNQILAWFQYLNGEPNNINDKIIEKPISFNSARQYAFSKLPSFFRRNNVSISFQKGEVPDNDKPINEKIWRNGDLKISKDKKKQCMKLIRDTFALVRDKAILLCKISSGMDDVDLFNLKIKDFKQGLDQELDICYIEGYRQKVRIRFQTFFNSEAVQMIQVYLKERVLKVCELKSEDWLFVTHRANKNGEYNKIKSNAFAKNLSEVTTKLNLQNITPKSFRRWFKSELGRNSIQRDIVERMMGHKTQVSASYEETVFDPEELLNLYAEELESITLLGNGKNKKMSQLAEDFKKLENQNAVLKDEINDTKKLLKMMISSLPEATKTMIEASGLLEKTFEESEETNKEE